IVGADLPDHCKFTLKFVKNRAHRILLLKIRKRVPRGLDRKNAFGVTQWTTIWRDILTTSELVTTGFDAWTCKLIETMKLTREEIADAFARLLQIHNLQFEDEDRIRHSIGALPRGADVVP
ncbi:MAG: hypothetical protein H7Z17_05155, partial [Fuerstia sp.]|nr:hypothetical protein [Fuerstiella sp.]